MFLGLMIGLASAPPPDRRPPTADELATARAAYRALGGKAEEREEVPFDAPDRYRFRPPEPLTVEAAGRLPDPPFAYELRLCVGPDTPPAAVAALARLTNLRAVWLDPPLDAPPDLALPHLRALRAVTQLRRLDLGQGLVFTPAAAEAVLGLPRLDGLAARYAATDAALAVLARHPALARLTVWSGGVTDAGLAPLAAMPGLRELDLSHCPGLTPAGLTPFAAAGRLTALAVSPQPRIEGPDVPAGPLLAAVGRIASLEGVTVGGYRGFTHADADLAHLARLPRLRRLRLPWYLDVTDGFLGTLAAAPALEEFAAGGGAMTDAGAKSLARVEPLRRLDLYSPARLTDAGAAALAELPRLERVSLESSRVTDAGAAALGRAPALADVALGWTRVTAAGAVALAEGCGPRLARLRLIDVRLTDAAVGRLARACPHLRELDLYQCDGATDACVPALAALGDLRRFPHGVGGLTRRGYAALAGRLPACDDLAALALLAGD